MKPRKPAPLPLTPAVWDRLTQQPAPKVRGVVIDGKPHVVITQPIGRTA